MNHLHCTSAKSSLTLSTISGPAAKQPHPPAPSGWSNVMARRSLRCARLQIIIARRTFRCPALLSFPKVTTNQRSEAWQRGPDICTCTFHCNTSLTRAHLTLHIEGWSQWAMLGTAPIIPKVFAPFLHLLQKRRSASSGSAESSSKSRTYVRTYVHCGMMSDVWVSEVHVSR